MRARILASIDQSDGDGGQLVFDLFCNTRGKLWLVWDSTRLYEVPDEKADGILHTVGGFMAGKLTAPEAEARALEGLLPRGLITDKANSRVQQTHEKVLEEVDLY